MTGTSGAVGQPGTSDHHRPLADQEPIRPIPREIMLDPGKVALGKKLFHDTRLSRDNTVACANCHDVSDDGADGLERSVGIGGAQTRLNAPTVFNSGFNFVQFWNGRAATLEDQIEGPIHAPNEMATSWPEIIAKLNRDSGMVSDFAAIYGGPIQSAAIKDAIATYERSLITPDSRFDRFLRGDETAITATERAGYELFKNYRCVACHQGVNVGGNLYAKIGVVGNYLADRGGVTDADLGRFNVTGRERDRQVFKVPSLRNVALTAPYFHDGSVKTLRSAVVFMAKYQLGRPISKEDVELIVAFLETLTGEYQGTPLWR
ncbi:MAG: cytochrome B6 [Rhodospirillales bacterium CG15_BIG_FIL_POST_REV_8_21_14_020_66_15]|nr:MAG: cytochrome B6 [Rhodospirillales bacterium CG15_BIG_FIL_POST_REV_8_21_14_020_66_15]